MRLSDLPHPLTLKPPTFLMIDMTLVAGTVSFVMKIVTIIHFQMVEWSQQSYHKFINCKTLSALAIELA